MHERSLSPGPKLSSSVQPLVWLPLPNEKMICGYYNYRNRLGHVTSHVDTDSGSLLPDRQKYVCGIVKSIRTHRKNHSDWDSAPRINWNQVDLCHLLDGHTSLVIGVTEILSLVWSKKDWSCNFSWIWLRFSRFSCCGVHLVSMLWLFCSGSPLANCLQIGSALVHRHTAYFKGIKYISQCPVYRISSLYQYIWLVVVAVDTPR